MPNPTDVRMETALYVFDAGHGIGGIRRGPRTSSALSCRAMNRRKGDSSGLQDVARTGAEDA